MTPRTDTTQALADTLAILQGKESPASLAIDIPVFMSVYEQAQKLLKDNHIAIMTRKGYRIAKHNPQWTRRVR